MSVCEVRPQGLQQVVGGIISEEKLAIVPDIHNYNFVSGGLIGCKRLSTDSDRLSIEELLNGDQPQLDIFAFPDCKRQCIDSNQYATDLSPSNGPDQFQLLENSSAVDIVFTSEVKDDYAFGAGKDTGIFSAIACGGNSPISSSPVTDFSTTTVAQSSAGNCQQSFDTFASADFFSGMQHSGQNMLGHQVTVAQAENYKLVITEQPEEVR